MAGRKCTVCNHKQKTEIDREIASGASLRSIAEQFGIKSNTNVLRHAQSCLSVDLGALQLEKKAESRLTVLEEFQKQLEHAKRVREIAIEYLSDPDDPLKLTLDPWAHEIDVVYYDQNDITEQFKPKKKRGQLSTLLAMLQLGPAQPYDDENMREAVRNEVMDTVEPRDFATIWDKAAKYFMHTRQSMDLRAEKIHIKHIDIRKFVLESLSTADMTIDKLAKIEGLYKAPEANDPKGKAIDAIKTLLMIRPDFDIREAMQYIVEMQRESNMILIEPQVMREVARENGILELEGMTQ